MKPFKLPLDLLMGSGSAATQIEGGDRNNTWYDWCLKGHIKDGSTTLRAADHWNRYPEDIALMEKLHQKVYRMSVEWSRIEPEPGVFNEEAMAHYIDEIKRMKAKGIEPLVSLHHFAEPLWFATAGGFTTEASVPQFIAFVEYVVESLGDWVHEYVTFNEPNVYAANGYHFGMWPPGEKNILKALKVLKILTQCHIKAYQTIHSIRKKKGFKGETIVGIAHHLRIFEPYNKNVWDKMATWAMEYLFQGAAIKAMSTGVLMPPIGLGAPWGKGKFYDFMGVNYYSRSAVRFKGFKDDFFPNTPKSDMGWDIYPEGMVAVCQDIYRRYPAPIWITENGVCDHKDAFRSLFIYDHLKQIVKLTEQGIPVKRYYHWSLTDNFEWLEGESAPFGLVELNFETQERTIKKSGDFYQEICSNHEVTSEMIEMYLKDEHYTIT